MNKNIPNTPSQGLYFSFFVEDLLEKARKPLHIKYF